MCVVIILMLGEVGQTELMLAGLIIFSIPIIDTILAIVRRRVQGKSFWTPDAKHMHHIFKQRMGSVKRAVLFIYAMGIFFAVLGAGLGILNLMGVLQNRFIYIVFILLVSIVVWIGWRMGKSELIEHDA
jgi:UDP-GlcNAc:undecaprenyl-phosphate GlcNAc-1-phosphate transferase